MTALALSGAIPSLMQLSIATASGFVLGVLYGGVSTGWTSIRRRTQRNEDR
jgi:hypothetical protein